MGKDKPLKKSPPLTFLPHRLSRHPHFQTIVSSLRRRRATVLQRTAQEIILDAGEGVRLQGFYSAQPDQAAKGLILLLHGWLGSANANYVLTLGQILYQRGYAIFRLNLRDHGNTHHLNPGIFRADLLEEVFAATRQISHFAPDRPLHLIGASLGGNFCLRLAWRHSQDPLPNLDQTITFCPALNPHQTTLALDTGPWIYLAYFRRRWRRMMKKKEAAFPDMYDFSEEIAASTCMEMTEAFIRRYSPFPNAMAYFDSYSITPEMIRGIRSPVTMIAAADDPIVPVADFEAFTDSNPLVRVYIQPYGGHVGFINLFPFRRWMTEATLAILED